MRLLIPKLLLACCLLPVACSNKLDISKSNGSKSYTFKSFSDSVASLSFSSKESLSEAVKSAFDGKSPDVVSHLTPERVLLASLSGKAVVIDLAKKASAEVSLPLNGSESSDWRIAFDKEFFWAVSGEKLLYKGNGGAGDDVATIENELSEILEGQPGGLRPIAVTASHLIGLNGTKLVVLNSVPQLRREMFLELDSASLANNPPSSVKSAGFIGERGIWLQVDSYLVYLLKDGSGSVTSQFSRLPEFRSDKGPLSNFRMSGFFESDENAVISQVGEMLISSGDAIFTAGKDQIVADAPKDNPDNNGAVTPQPASTATPTPTPTANVVTLEQLQQKYTNQIKTLIDSRCVQCHANRTSRWNNFDAVKLFADQGAGRVDTGDMPRGSPLSNTEKTELANFLRDLARLP